MIRARCCFRAIPPPRTGRELGEVGEEVACAVAWEGLWRRHQAYRVVSFFQRMIRTFGIGPRAQKVVFFRFGIGPSGENVIKSQGKCFNKVLGKLTVFGPFWGPWTTIPCQKRRPCFFYNFHNVSVFFCIFSPSQHYATQHTPIPHAFLCFFLRVFIVFPHTHAHAHTRTHTDAHLHVPPTVILRVV